ncbi:hypothetical protein [Pedobacter gandavensis]|uniref:hypothetical protein n=1 Tax=Pedobacter gandavensis TaxID=2679963 RepID=UPI00292DEB76|nr:hypothetical protein [Pedobacter gandavensis]
MKKLLMICGLLFSVITFAQAQDGGRQKMTPEERVQRSVAGLSKKLNLNEDQKTKAAAIFLDQMNAMEKARAAGNTDKEARRAEMMKLSEETDAKIAEILTADQKKTYETYKAERKERMKGNRMGQGPKAGGEQ